MSHDLETFEIVEGTTPDYVVTLLDKKNQSPIPASAFDSLTLTYFHEYTEEIINGRSEQNVLQLNGISVDESGVLRWVLTQADAVILDDGLHDEPHIASFRFTYPSVDGPEVGRHVVRLLVGNVRLAP
jgi:hypothetical protein